ncbi:MAG: hypothetical protein WA224_24800 [Candidatus Acidiferrales bacterium]
MKPLASARFAAKVIHYLPKRWSSRHLQPHVKHAKRKLIIDVKKSLSDVPMLGAKIYV